MNKSRKRVEQDYARNAIADGNTKAGKYEAKMAVKEAAGESPAKMYGKKKDSPAHNQNKGYESAGQERKNLMNDNPVASHGSWMAKHSQSRMGSPMKMDYGSPMEKELVGKQENLPEALKAKMATDMAGPAGEFCSEYRLADLGNGEVMFCANVTNFEKMGAFMSNPAEVQWDKDNGAVYKVYTLEEMQG